MSENKKGKTPFKEKFISIYESFFKGEDFIYKYPSFWDELFLLRVNSNYLLNEFKSMSNDDLSKIIKNINFLFNKAIDILKFEINPIRLHNIIHTLYVFIHSISINKQFKLNTYELINLCIGIDNAETQLQVIFDTIYNLLTNESSPSLLKEISLKFLLSLVSLTENINENAIVDYFMLNSSLFEALIQIISQHKSRLSYGRDALLLLTLLLQYQKYESENPYIGKLSILDDELALTGLAQVMSAVLVEYNRLYTNERKQQEGESWWNNFGTFIGNMFVGDEEKRKFLKLDDAILLVFYECVHLNRNFISALTHAASEFTMISPTTSTATNNNNNDSNAPLSPQTPTKPINFDHQQQLNPSLLLASQNYQQLQPPTSLSLTINNNNNDQQLTPVNSLDIESLINPTHPSNLLTIFLQTCSEILQETKIDQHNIYDLIKLFMIILVCISEDQYANSLLHDSNMVFSVFLYQAKHRHRKVNLDKIPASRPLATSVLDLMIEFMQTHLMKSFPFELYLKSIGIVQRLMCYQKKYKIRLQYQWQNLWICLINVLKFVINSDSVLLSKGYNLFSLCSRIIVIFNIFITYGDTFLPNPESYDYLYYDILRMKQVFDNLISFANRYASSSEWKDYVPKLIIQLANVKAIINHFTPRIDAWSAANHATSLTEQQVLDIVRTNYDSLTLKLEDNLDQYDRYSERPHETTFFTLLLRRIVNDLRTNIEFAKFENTNIIQELGALI